MADWTSAENVRTALNRLIETQEEAFKARDERTKYQEVVRDPAVRDTYEGVEELLVYIKEKANYETGLARAEDKVKDAEAACEEAADQVREFLPEGSQVIHDYHGPHGSGEATRYTIHHDPRGNVKVTSSRSA